MLEVIRKNWKWLLGIILLVWCLASLPYIIVFLFGDKDTVFLGQFFNPDTFVYFQYIRQIIDGGVFVHNQFNPVVDAIGFFNIFWLVSGLLGKFLGFSPVGTFMFLKYLLSPILIFVSFYVLQYIFSGDNKKTKLAHSIMLFGGGFGYVILILRMFGYAEHNMASYYFMDIWATEISPYLSMFETPHFIFSWTLLILCFYYILRIFSDGKIGYAWKGSLVFGVLAQFHPYYIPVVTLFFFVRALFYFADKKNILFIFKRACIFGLFPLVSAVYFLYAYSINDVLRSVALNNITQTPPLSNILGSFGFLIVFSFLYVWERFRNDWKQRSVFLYVCALGLIQLFLLFAPYSQQRRNIEGMNFTFAILTVQALSCIDTSVIAKWSRYVLRGVVASLFFSCAMFFIYYTILFGITIHGYATESTSIIEQTREKPPVVMTKEEKKLLDYMKTLDRGVVLASPRLSFMIPFYTGHNVFAGHWAETISYKKSASIYPLIYGEKKDMDSRINYVVIDTKNNSNERIDFARSNLLANNFFEAKIFDGFILFIKNSR